MTEELEKTLIYEAKHVLEKLGEEEKKELEKLSKEYIEFLSEVKTERECVEYFTTILEKKGFKENQLERGYFVYRNKFLACWKPGRNPLKEGLRI
ncbi:MAG: aminopeptidase, partial [Thermodesulfobacteriaceae bacterium]|nr:aminopeptidase [Thermodesulfobacteriaceae bacterium]